MNSLIEKMEQIEWNNSKNQKCKFFFNTITNHYVLSVNGFYFEHNRMLRNNLITNEDLATFDSLNLSNMRDNIDFLKRIFKIVNGGLIRRKKEEIQNENDKIIIKKINKCTVYF